MADTKTTPLRERMIEDMRIKGLGESSQKAHIRAVRYFAEFLGRSPDTATPEDLRAYQLHMVNTNVTPSTYNVRLVGLRFFFEMTCQRPEMKQCLHYRTEPRKLPVVFSAEEVFELLKVAPGPGLKYRAALSISYGTGLRASEVCNLKVTDIDSDRMLIHVEKGTRKATAARIARSCCRLAFWRFCATIGARRGRMAGSFQANPGSIRSHPANCTVPSAQPSIWLGSRSRGARCTVCATASQPAC
ncbi:site-specific integrase [Leisingera sp. M523]|nr:site-specific integrase [Leisingera sp. M523]